MLDAFSFRLHLLTFLSAIGGFLFGYDTGVISGAMLLLRQEFSLNHVWQEMIVSGRGSRKYLQYGALKLTVLRIIYRRGG